MPKRKGTEEEVNGSGESPGKKVATDEKLSENGHSTKEKVSENGHSTVEKVPENGHSTVEKVPENGHSTVEEDNSADLNRLSSDGREHNLKISSWNVAGLRAVEKKKGMEYVKEEDADIICLQETKVIEKEVPADALALKKGGKIFDKGDTGYHMYLYPAEKKGYSGVALWSKVKPLNVKYGMGIAEHDKEGRLITAEYEKYYVLTSYVPNAGKKLVNLEYRRTWNTALKDYINDLNEKKPVIFCGDLNVSHEEIDLANPKANKRNAGFTKEEREDFTELLAEGYIDTFRHFNPDKTGAYTFWTYIGGARDRNVGWRLDYFLISKSLENSLCNSIIRSKVMGSDHCPIVLTMAI